MIKTKYDDMNGRLPVGGASLLIAPLHGCRRVSAPLVLGGMESNGATFLKEPTMNDVFKAEIERMEKLGYTDEEMVRQIQTLLRVQNMVVYATL